MVLQPDAEMRRDDIQLMGGKVLEHFFAEQVGT